MDGYDLVPRYGTGVQLAAGSGIDPDDETVTGYVAFRRGRLRAHRLSAARASLVDVVEENMESTMCDGDSVLVDHARTDPEEGRIFALRTADGALVKRLRWRGGRWVAMSDHPNHSPRPLGANDAVIERIVWWAHTEA